VRLKLNLLLVVLTLSQSISFSQVVNTGTMDTTGGIKIDNLKIGGYIDSYYGYHFSQPKDGNVPYFVSMNRHNEANINLAYIDLRYSKERTRACFIPGFGTYINANYAAEPGVLKNIVEASIGYQISKKKDIWVDFGVLGSPYTNESAFSKDHLMYSRGFAPEYVPYYLSGAKFYFPLNKKVNSYVYLLNGWQQIVDQNNSKAIGTQIEYRPNDKNLINWNTFIGDERSVYAPNNRMRYFTDVYWLYNLKGKFSITSCAYIGLQQRLNAVNQLTDNFWWQYNFTARYKFNDKLSLSGRLEYFSDPDNVQINSITGAEGFSSYCAGLCLNVQLSENLMFRLEGRQFYSDKKHYLNQNLNPANQATWLISNFTIWF